MKYKRLILHTVCIILAVMMACIMTSCGADDSSKRAENEQTLLRAMTEYPGDGLYDPMTVEIGIGTDSPTEEQYAEAEKKAAEEKQAWENAVGPCFADGMFETFYGKWYRTYVIGFAYARGLTTSMSDFRIEDNDSTDNIEHALFTVTAAGENGDTRTFDMDWMIVFDKDDPTLIQKIEMINEGGFEDAYTND